MGVGGVGSGPGVGGVGSGPGCAGGPGVGVLGPGGAGMGPPGPGIGGEAKRIWPQPEPTPDLGAQPPRHRRATGAAAEARTRDARDVYRPASRGYAFGDEASRRDQRADHR